MVIDHVGIVVPSLDRGIAQWRDTFGYSEVTSPVVNTRQRVRVVFLSKPGSCTVKLVEPLETSSPVAALAARGGGLHHLCFRCADLDAGIAELAGAGGRVLAAPQPGEAFENEPIAFVFAGNGLNVELIATDRKACRLTPPPSPGAPT